MNLEEINKQHLVRKGLSLRVEKGLASKLIKYEHQIIHIELEVRPRWRHSLSAAAHVVARSWWTENDPLKKAVAAKVFIIDSRHYSYKRTLLHLGIKPGYDAQKGVFFR